MALPFQIYISNTQKQIEAALSKFVASLDAQSLHSQIGDAVLSKGKRLRPLLVILSAESVGGSCAKVMPLAMAFEFMHTATLIHDDIIDQDEIRRGTSSLHKKWSTNEAILTGDSLIAHAVNLASGYGEAVIKALAQSAIELCRGENLDIQSTLGQTTEKTYFQKIQGKAASLFKAATYCGAFAGGGTPLEVDTLASFGESIGMAYQLKDDLLDFTGEGNYSSMDIKQGRITLPLIHAYEHSNHDERKTIEQELVAINSDGSHHDQKKVEKLVRIIQRKGSFIYCERKLGEYLHKAKLSISSLKDTEYKSYFTDIIRIIQNME